MKTNIPKLRFIEFKDAPAWEEKKLGEVSNINPKSSLPESFKYISLESVDKGFLKTSEDFNIDNAPSRAQRLLQKGDFIFQTVRPYQKNNLIFDLDGKYVASTGYAQFRESEKMKNVFAKNCLESEGVNKQIIDNCTGSNYPAINTTTLKRIKIILPNAIEQEKVGEFLSTLDRRIELQEKLIEKLEEEKKGYLQKLFPKIGNNVPELRFDQFKDAGEWERDLLLVLFDIETFQSKSKFILNEGLYKIVDMGSVTEKGELKSTKKTNIKYDFLNKGDLVMPKDDIGGGKIIGKTAYIPVDNTYIAGDHIFVLKSKDLNGCDPLFYNYFFNSGVYLDSVLKKVTGSAQLGINRENLTKELIPITSNIESKCVYSVLESLTKRVCESEKLRNELILMKKIMLNEVLV